MGFLDKLKEKGQGVVTAAKPEDGVEPEPEDEVRRRLLAIEGEGIEVGEDGDEVVVSFAVTIRRSGAAGGGLEHRYRALRVELDAGERTAKGVCFKTESEAEIGYGGTLTASKGWERGQHIGSETMHVVGFPGGGETDRSGFKFSWSDLREPVIEAVTGAGWTYKPKRV